MIIILNPGTDYFSRHYGKNDYISYDKSQNCWKSLGRNFKSLNKAINHSRLIRADVQQQAQIRKMVNIR